MAVDLIEEESQEEGTTDKINCDQPPKLLTFLGAVDPAIACARLSGVHVNQSSGKQADSNNQENIRRLYWT